MHLLWVIYLLCLNIQFFCNYLWWWILSCHFLVWHQVQTYLSYCQLQTLLSPTWVGPWDTIKCDTWHCSSIRNLQSAWSCRVPWVMAAAFQNTPVGPPSIAIPDYNDPSLHNTYILFITHGSCSSTFSSLFHVFTMDYQRETCRICSSSREKMPRKRRNAR